MTLFLSPAASGAGALRFLHPPSPKAVGAPHVSYVVCARRKPQDSSESGRRVWRRRKLTRKDARLQFNMERVPFLEEQVRKIRESGKIISMDIERLLLSEDNKFAFVNEVAAEATALVESNPDEYGGKKPILHVLSDRVNEAGFYRSDAYLEADPFKPGPTYIRDQL